ncbi:multicopper oxidase [Plectosphaerella plurivora]|uniref:Multicopper oxidase n=1 Tax=Plectosphaerella plurivora TaxID=936078 RepID=A0A9P8VBS6_9PEZI|nr:multicopper oxidase [Plectosphaerella plurivora]
MLILPTVLGLLAWSVAAEKHAKVFNLTLTWETVAPNGVEREMIHVNGQFPGPTLELFEGDDVEVNVLNKLPFNTSVHYHGIEMLNTPWSDGVAGLTQRPISTGSTFTYKWKATQHGSHWYHAHLRGQVEDGLYGPIIIHPSRKRTDPFGLISSDGAAIHAMQRAAKKTKPIVLSDFRHMTSHEVEEVAFAANMELTCYDAILVNGKGSSQCRSPEEIAALLSPEQTMILGMVGLNMTDKACLPAEFISSGVGDLSKIPPDVFSGCQETTGGESVIEFETSRCDGDEHWIAFELIGALGFAPVMVSVDELSMWVYAVDGEYVLPQKVNAIPVTNGDRYSILVKVEKTGDFTLRAAGLGAPQIISGKATVSIRAKGQPDAPPPTEVAKPFILDNGAPTSPDVVIFAQPLAKPFPPSPIPKRADAFHHLTMRMLGTSLLWSINGTALLPADHEADVPLLFKPPPSEPGATGIFTKYGDWVDIVFETAVAPMPPHPMHKHGNKMYHIGAGAGHFEWASVNEAVDARPELFNLVDPPQRDTFVTPPAQEGVAWMAVRYHVTNPGPWLLHCHIQNHMTGGMTMVIYDGVDKWPTVPDEYLNIGGGEGAEECEK